MPTYADWQANPYQYALEDYNTSTPEGDVLAVSYSPGYAIDLLAQRERVLSGQATPWERAWYQQQEQAALAVPMRDVGSLTYNAGEDAPDRLSGGSPDLARIMLTLQDKMQQGTATPHERELFGTAYTMLADQNWRASVPQASDANPFGLGDQLFGALATLGLGATGGLAAAPLFAGGASLATTLGSLGTLSGIAGTGAGVLGQALDQPWLSKAGTYLGALGGLAGGAGGLANLWSSGVQSLGDAARLAQSASRITGAVGSASGNEGLRQASRYLGQAGQLGQVGSQFLPTSLTDWSGTNAPLAANVAPQIDYRTSSAPLTPQDWQAPRGGGMANGDWLDFETDDWYTGGNVYAGGSPTFNEGGYAAPIGPGLGWDAGGYPTGGYNEPIGPGLGWDAGGYPTGDTSGGGGFWGTLGSLGSAALGFLGKNAGPLASALGSLGGGAIGSNAASDASRLQANALNRGIDLQTAQWLQQQANQAPWLQAGQQALPQLQQLAARGAPGPFQSGWGIVKGSDYALPGTRPGWDPQQYQGPQAPNAGDYRWTPGQGPRAGDYRYTPGQTPDAAQYASGPPSLYQGAMPGTQVSTLTGQQVLDQDPGAAFRQSEARKALEGSAAARGDLLSGQNLKALQARSQDLASQEYGNAWERMMRRGTEQYGRDWGQYQQAWTQGVTGAELGLRTNAQNFAQAEAAARLREQVNQVASQQGWTQAQAEAVFREQQGQLASQQGWNQALAGQQNQYTQGLQSQQWNQEQQQKWQQEQYQRLLAQNELQYGRDWKEVETGYQRDKDWYNSMLGQDTATWNRLSSLAGLGQTAVGQLGQQGQNAQNNLSNLLAQLGLAQGTGAAGEGLAWTRALGGATNNLTSTLAGLNA